MKTETTQVSQPDPQEPAEATGPWTVVKNSASRLSEVIFALFVILMLTTPSYRSGPFTWLPLLNFSELGGVPASVGLLTLLPFLFGVSWLVYLLATWRSGRPRAWTWGRLGVTIPLLLLTVFGMASLDRSMSRIVFIQFGGLIIFWVLYLYLLNNRPKVVLPLGIVVFVQGMVALGQFLKQSDLNLIKFGELPLDPLQSGIVVLFARNQRWLRGYGLTVHPNLLGAMLTAILLLLLPALKRAQGRKRVMLIVIYAIGLAGLLVTFSRASILAFIAGLLAWLILDWRREKRRWSFSQFKKAIRSPVFLLAVVILVVVLLFFGDLILSRVVALDSQVEAISLNQRLFDWKIALDLIGRHPLRGVGLGQYVIAAKALNPLAITVHNVPLLVTAELGIGGLLLFLWLTISGLRSRPEALAVWIAVMIIGLFDVTLWLTGSWQTSVLLAVIIANLSQDITAS